MTKVYYQIGKHISKTLQEAKLLTTLTGIPYVKKYKRIPEPSYKMNWETRKIERIN